MARKLGRRVIGPGAKGWDVAALQWLLATRGFPSGRSTVATAVAPRLRSSASRPGPASAPTASPDRRRSAPPGATVVAAGRGCVSSVGYDPGGYGRLAVIQHRAGMTSWYAHLSRITVRTGTCLVAGNQIGRVGSSGFTTGPHLHFELRLRGAAIDPRTGF